MNHLTAARSRPQPPAAVPLCFALQLGLGGCSVRTRRVLATWPV